MQISTHTQAMAGELQAALSRIDLGDIRVAGLVRRLLVYTDNTHREVIEGGWYSPATQVAGLRADGYTPLLEAAAHELLGHAADHRAGEADGLDLYASTEKGTLCHQIAVEGRRLIYDRLVSDDVRAYYAASGQSTVLAEAFAYSVQFVVRLLMFARGRANLRSDDGRLVMQPAVQRFVRRVRNDLFPWLAELSQDELPSPDAGRRLSQAEQAARKRLVTAVGWVRVTRSTAVAGGG